MQPKKKAANSANKKFILQAPAQLGMNDLEGFLHKFEEWVQNSDAEKLENIEIDLAQTNSISTPGIQLMVAIAKEQIAKGRSVTITNQNASIEQAWMELALEAELKQITNQKAS
jgi:anti-anti-sigma regulatory factor